VQVALAQISLLHLPVDLQQGQLPSAEALMLTSDLTERVCAHAADTGRAAKPMASSAAMRRRRDRIRSQCSRYQIMWGRAWLVKSRLRACSSAAVEEHSPRAPIRRYLAAMLRVLLLVIDGTSTPVYLELLDQRVIDGDNLSGDGPRIGLDVPNLQPPVIETIKLSREMAPHIFD
jgi:hypothetical protein